ncbi:MarR family winged helix-turn-helix transcriptional regulator [Falsirhodobacter halotolerans]|uniref:MarR family winged helix-turn-helix transcriptional regulator n=1 Tax=Falsirhodobacter halotolerans TaxID=1146892 RepID=UPI001FD18DD2|nr:MarR family transcriptional regulator [Falsirhodobacter halotolerans]MCJ8139009.1 MarR family transcriptional regulator [Falsirhodobacter halotolerans]
MPEITRSDFGTNIIMLGRRWRRLVDQDARTLGFTEAVWPPLLHLGLSGGGITQTALAARAGVDGSTLVRAVTQLIDAGLIERRPDMNDRRARRLYLTNKGEAAVLAITRIMTDLETRMLATFSAEEAHRAVALIRRIALSLEDKVTAPTKVTHP